MILITKEEADYIRAHSDRVKIITTSRGKNARQKKRYADEVGDTFRLLRKYHKKAGARNGTKAKS